MPSTQTPRGASILTRLNWLAGWSGALLLVGDDEGDWRQTEQPFRWSWFGLLAVSAVWGSLMVLLYGLTWRLFGDYSGVPLMPAAAMVAANVLLLYRRAVLSLASYLGRSPQAQSLAACAIVLVLALAMLGLKGWDQDERRYLPYGLEWLRPNALYRPLVLAPLWGAWAMLVTVQFCRPRVGVTDPRTAAFARGCGAVAAAASMAVPLAMTIVYFNYLPWTQFSMSAATVMAAILSGLVFCAAAGGLCRRALLATNLLTQIVFLLAYLANIR